jgi:hypothetical protein
VLIYSFAHDEIALWLLGMAWSCGFIGVWGRSRYTTRIRGASTPAKNSTRSASDLGFADRELLGGMHPASPTGLALPSPQETRLAAIGPQGKG